jgi:3-hydroxybutyrate dehydrogenase
MTRVLDKRTALVTGAASGIGRALARRAVADGAVVLGVDRDEVGLKSLADEFPDKSVRPLVCDLADLEAVDALAAKHGRVDVVANVAGFLRFGSVEETAVAVLDEALRVMVQAAWVLAHHAMPYMRRRRWGRFVNVTSVHGRIAARNKGAYVTCKHAMEGLSRTIALEGAGWGITSNCIAPTHTETDLLTQQMVDEGALHAMTGTQYRQVLRNQIPDGRFVRASEVADVAAVLWGPASASISGASWTIDGGHTVRGDQGRGALVAEEHAGDQTLNRPGSGTVVCLG